ncbi:MAG: DNA-3-methyladenine glycosylase family protein [Pseudohongiellaceae bacterium]|jgi:DNA-3-methyladenine glycosylase II
MNGRVDDPVLLRRAQRQLAKADPTLAALMARVGPCRLVVNESQDLFLALARAIVFQQLHGKAAEAIFQRTAALFTQSAAFTAADIAAASDEQLQSAGLSRNKQLALRDLAARVLQGSLPTMPALQVMDDDSIIDTLTRVRGIGRWTVQMLLIFRLGRVDVLPVDDYGVRKGFMLLQGLGELPSTTSLRLQGERWAPYRTVASWYLWRATELPW